MIIIKIEDVSTDQVFLINTWKLHGLESALDKLSESKIPCECNLDSCFLLMRKAAKGDDAANKAFGFSITQAAKQARSSITKNPKYKRMIDDIAQDRKRAEDLKLSTYRALYPFAKKVYEFHEVVLDNNCGMKL